MQSLESVLTQLNSLNRSLEGIIEVCYSKSEPSIVPDIIQARFADIIVPVDQQIGNEFASVEALWSQFEGVMGDRGKQQQQQEAGWREEEGEGADDGHGDGEVDQAVSQR